MRYVAFLRGINVGGNNKVSMTVLKGCFESAGFTDVITYINSGNIIFETTEANTLKLRTEIETLLKATFNIDLTVVLVESERYKTIIKGAPKWWGVDETWKHNIIFLIEPYEMNEVIAEIGVLKPSIESIESSAGVLFQSVEFAKFGQATTGKIASKPIYKKMTVRNFNTAQKILNLLNA